MISSFTRILSRRDFSTFKILPTEKVVKIVANSSEHQYGGNAYTDNGYKIYFDGAEVTDGKLLYGDIIGNVKAYTAILYNALTFSLTFKIVEVI